MVQEKFLSALTQNRVPVTIYLVNGIRLQGVIESFDQYGLILNANAQQFVFKQAISTVVPTQEANDPPVPRTFEEKKPRRLSLSK